MDLPWDFRCWEWRRMMGATWADVARTPRWRIERDLAYAAVEDRARAWHAAQRTAEDQKNAARFRLRGGGGR